MSIISLISLYNNKPQHDLLFGNYRKILQEASSKEENGRKAELLLIQKCICNIDDKVSNKKFSKDRLKKIISTHPKLNSLSDESKDNIKAYIDSIAYFKEKANCIGNAFKHFALRKRINLSIESKKIAENRKRNVFEPRLFSFCINTANIDENLRKYIINQLEITIINISLLKKKLNDVSITEQLDIDNKIDKLDDTKMVAKCIYENILSRISYDLILVVDEYDNIMSICQLDCTINFTISYLFSITNIIDVPVKGRGTAAIEASIFESKKRGFKGKITLCALSNAIPFYESHGFRNTKLFWTMMDLSSKNAEEFLTSNRAGRAKPISYLEFISNKFYCLQMCLELIKCPALRNLLTFH